jgi:hypothetical protein
LISIALIFGVMRATRSAPTLIGSRVIHPREWKLKAIVMSGARMSIISRWEPRGPKPLGIIWRALELPANGFPLLAMAKRFQFAGNTLKAAGVRIGAPVLL